MPNRQNAIIAANLQAMANLLAQQGDRGFRPAAYQRAAEWLDRLETPVSDILAQGGFEGLVALPTIGEGIARAIVEMVATGQWSRLDRLRGELDPEAVFQLIPGVGPQLAHLLHENLGVDTLEQLELAVHDGSLARLPGVSRRRVDAIRVGLEDRLGRRISHMVPARPPVGLLLEIDALYRKNAAAGVLRTIAPRRMNPKGASWLPVMHEDRKGWRFTALFSNTARAHKLGRTSDWVLVYAHRDGDPEAQFTVVTEGVGPLKGRRVVRGREAECEEHYEEADAPA
jgi:hypothetical protein